MTFSVHKDYKELPSSLFPDMNVSSNSFIKYIGEKYPPKKVTPFNITPLDGLAAYNLNNSSIMQTLKSFISPSFTTPVVKSNINATTTKTINTIKPNTAAVVTTNNLNTKPNTTNNTIKITVSKPVVKKLKPLSADAYNQKYNYQGLPIENPDGSYRGMTTADVVQLQQNLGFTGKDVDGKFGPKTMKALISQMSGAPIAIPSTLVENKINTTNLNSDNVQPVQSNWIDNWINQHQKELEQRKIPVVNEITTPKEEGLAALWNKIKTAFIQKDSNAEYDRQRKLAQILGNDERTVQKLFENEYIVPMN